MIRIISATIVLLFMTIAIAQQQSQPKAQPKTQVQAQPQAQPASTAIEKISVTKAVIALNVANLIPENPSETFPPEVKRLFCFTQIKTPTLPLEIQHRWYWKDELIGTIPLQIKTNNYRTYSTKTIPAGYTGDWRVAIVNSKNEEILQMVHFTIK
jgi:hypothetical protein